MTIINLRDFYYWYTQDEYIEVSDDVAEALRASVRSEAAYTERARYNKAYYSLDADDGIEFSACLHELTPGRGFGDQGAVLPSVERAEQPARNPGPPGGRSLYPRHDLPGDCPGRGRGQERGAAFRSQRHRTDEKIF